MNLTGVVIDAGHGGADSGAVGNGIVEKDLTLEISKYMYDKFREKGIPVKLTRTDDTALNSVTRPRKVLEAFGNGKNVIVISNHINAGGAEGAEVIYALRNDDTLSNLILNNLSKKGQKIRKAYQRRLPSNSSKDYYYIMRSTPNTESLIVEYGFLDNIRDAEKLKTKYKDYVDAVVDAVLEYKNISNNSAATSGYYTVKSGDTLWSIARLNNTTVDEIKRINNLSSNLLSVGQKIKLSSNNNDLTENYYIVKLGDTLYGIANRYGISVNDLKNANNLTNNIISIGQKLIIPIANNYKSYTVINGDTLYGIANKFNTTVDILKNINNINSNILTIGQKLLIP